MALPQLIPGAQFPYNFAAALASAAPNLSAATGFYYPQPMSAAAQAAAAAQSNYLGLQGYTAFNNFGSYPQPSYIRSVSSKFNKSTKTEFNKFVP
jgi:hypothetical protein